MNCREDTLYIELESLYALQIFRGNDKYSCNQDKNKKHYLFDLVNHTHSALGCKLLRHWFSCPLANRLLINERLDTVEVLTSEKNLQHVTNLARFQRHLPNINHTLSSIQIGKPNAKSWKNLVCFLENAIEIYQTVNCLERKESTKILAKILEEIDVTTLRALNIRINQMIDFDLSTQWKRIYIRDGLDTLLDTFRKDYDQLETTLASAASHICSNYSGLHPEAINVVYMPQLGYLISVDLGSHIKIPNTWSETFATSSNVYYKEAYTLDMDNDLGDVYQFMIDLEIEFLYQLQNELIGYSNMLLRAGILFAELDCFMSLASVSMLNDYVKPEIVESTVIEIKAGRHPLYEHLVTSYIPNNTNIEENQVSIITGANASGKSLYLSQIGLIVYMAHLGCYIPAEYAKIGVTDKILTRIATMESLEKCESTFLIDLQKMSKNLHIATQKSLLLIDEFGKGTDIIGGSALLGSIIENISQGEHTSRALVTTHFHELFKSNVLPVSTRVVHSHMDVMFQPARDEGPSGNEKLVYLYQLKKGLATNSFGIKYV